MSWGKGIALVILGFVVFMSAMVYKAVNQDFYLVSDNYYSEGLEYDKVQEKIKNVKNLDEKISFSQKDNNIEIYMPTEVKGGTVHFFRPSNGTLDFNIVIPNRNFIVEKSKVKSGKWLMKFSWTDGNKEYYFEESISVL